eukprot:5930995-Amphidinium_carterae.1
MCHETGLWLVERPLDRASARPSLGMNLPVCGSKAMWREFRDKLTSRVWSADGEADDAEPKKRSKWDDKSPSTSKWARPALLADTSLSSSIPSQSTLRRRVEFH